MNQLALITGASSGIGAACAEQLANRGMNLILLARRAENLNQLASELRHRYKINVHTVAIDVTHHHAVQQMVLNLPQEWQSIDILINNAGLAAGLDRFQQANIHDWEAMIDTNIKGLLYISRYVLPGMIARGRGHIVNIGSVAAHQTYPGGSVYCATKSAVAKISEGLRLDTNGSGVRVTNIDPGMVETEFSLVRFKGDAHRAKQVYEGMTPLKPADIADAVIYSITRPPHVNIAEITLYPTDQASPTVVHRHTRVC